MGPEFLRKYNTLLVSGSTSIKIPIIKRGVVDFAVSADWTPVAGDVKISKDGGAAANVTNLPTAVTMGNTAYWDFVLTAAELSCAMAVVTVADSATKAVEDQCFVVATFGHPSARFPADWLDGVRLGLTSLPAAAAGANGGLPLGDANSRVDVGRWLGQTPNALVSGKVDSTLAVRGGTAQAGAPGSLTLDAGAPLTDNLYRGLKLAVVSGTGAGQQRLITGYTGSSKVATVIPNWVTTPDATSVFIVTGHASVDVQQVNLTAQTARDLGAQLDATMTSRAAASVFSGITSLANWLRLALRLGYTDATALGEINTGGTGAFDPATESLEYIAGNLSGGAGDWTATEKQHIRNRLGIDGSASVPSATPTLALETSVQSRLPTVSYVAPDNASIGTILTRTDVATSTRAAASVFSGITSLANWLRLALRLGYTDATALGEINTGGTGAFAPATESLEAIAAAGGGGGGGGDPLTNLVPGTYTAGTDGEALGRIGTGTINVVVPLSASGDLTLIAGDDYLAVDSRALSFSNPAGSWPDLTGARITFVAIRNGSTLIEVTGAVTTPTGSQLVTVEPTAEDLAPPANANASWEYIYGVYATLANGSKVTLQTGKLTLQRAH